MIRSFRETGGEISDVDLTKRLQVSTRDDVVQMLAAVTALETIGAITSETKYSLTPFGQQYYKMRHSQPN